MVRAREKKAKGDEAFGAAKKQKVGRKKLAPATSTRAEVTARGLRVGVAKTILEAQQRHTTRNEETQNNNNNNNNNANASSASRASAYASSSDVRVSLPPKQVQEAPDVSKILVSIAHYKAGSRTQSLRTAVTWVQHRKGLTAQESPGATIQLLNGALAALTDTDEGTRDAARAVILAVDRLVLTPSRAWPAVAESVADRISIALTHAHFGARTSAVQLLSDMAAAAGTTNSSANLQSFFRFLCTAGVAAADAAVEHMLCQVVLVVKTKAPLFSALPAILHATLGSSDNSSNSSSEEQDGGAAGSSSSSFCQRHPNLVIDCLRDVWEFGCVRVKESFELGIPLLRNDVAMPLVIGILRSTAILTAAAAASSAAAQHNQLQLPDRDFFSGISHMCTARVPVSLDDLCAAKTTTPRKAALATALGHVFKSLLMLADTANGSNKYGDCMRAVRKPLAQIVAFGFDLADSFKSQDAAGSSSTTEIPALASFAFEAAAAVSSSCSSSSSAASASLAAALWSIFTPKMLAAIPKWLDVVLRMLRAVCATGNVQQAETLHEIITKRLLPVLRGTMRLPAAAAAAVTSSSEGENAGGAVDGDCELQIASCWSMAVQFLFMLRSLIVAAPPQSGVTPLLLSVSKHAVQLLYDFLSTGGRTFFDTASTKVKSNNNNNKHKHNYVSVKQTAKEREVKERWIKMLSSVSSIVAMSGGFVAPRSDAAGGEGEAATAENQRQMDDDAAAPVEAPWVLGTILVAPNDANCARIVDPATRSLCFGCLYYGAACLRAVVDDDNSDTNNSAAALPAGWLLMAKSATLRRQLAALPSGSQYVRLLDFAI